MTKWAEPQNVQAATQRWNDNIVACRTYGHSWRPLTVFMDSNGYTVQQRCSRCGNRRAQEMDLRGFATPWRYSYTDGYLTKDLGRIGTDGRAVLRLAAIRNLTVREVPER